MYIYISRKKDIYAKPQRPRAAMVATIFFHSVILGSQNNNFLITGFTIKGYFLLTNNFLSEIGTGTEKWLRRCFGGHTGRGANLTEN